MPGSVVRKTVKGQEYIYWRFYLANGRRNDEYPGPANDSHASQAMEARLANSREARQIADSVKTLRLSGFAVADNSPALTIASLFNAGIFRQGGVLVGSHVFGALLNGLGIKLAANYCTDDIDIGTAAPVALAIPDDRSFLGVLRDMVVSTLRPAGLGANSRKDQQQKGPTAGTRDDGRGTGAQPGLGIGGDRGTSAGSQTTNSSGSGSDAGIHRGIRRCHKRRLGRVVRIAVRSARGKWTGQRPEIVTRMLPYESLPQHAPEAPQKIDCPVCVVNHSSASVPASELPLLSSPGDHTHTAISPGSTATMPPPTPLFAGRPTRKTKSPAAS